MIGVSNGQMNGLMLVLVNEFVPETWAQNANDKEGVWIEWKAMEVMTGACAGKTRGKAPSG